MSRSRESSRWVGTVKKASMSSNEIILVQMNVFIAELSSSEDLAIT